MTRNDSPEKGVGRIVVYFVVGSLMLALIYTITPEIVAAVSSTDTSGWSPGAKLLFSLFPTVIILGAIHVILGRRRL